MMAVGGWEFWELTEIGTGQVAWLGLSHPGGRSSVERSKIWTLIPNTRVFIANWFVTADHYLDEGTGLWIHENVDISDARDMILDIPQPSQEDLDRITRPETCLTLDQIDRIPVEKVLGKRAARMLQDRVI